MQPDPQTKLPIHPKADALDRAIYDLMPDRYGHCTRQRSQNKYFRANRREEIIKAVKDLLNANNATGQG